MPWKAKIGKESHLVSVTISNKDTFLPAASSFGYDKKWARVGDWVIWQNNPTMSDHMDHGRVLGQIVEHGNDKVDIHGYLVVLNVNEALSSTYIQYVNPAHVKRCVVVNTDFVRFVLGIAIDEKSVREIPKLVDGGWLNDRSYEKAVEKLYMTCEEHGTYKADGKYVTCPVCGGRATNE